MPMYVVPVTIPPNTPDHNPIRVTSNPIRGFITRMEIEFPDGCLNAVGIRVYDNGKQIAPLPTGWLTGNGRIIEWYENTRLEGPPWVIVIEGYNDAIDWPHTPVLRFEVR